MSKKALRRDEFLRHLLWISVLAVGIVLYYYRLYDMVMAGSALFLSGLFFLCTDWDCLTQPSMAPRGFLEKQRRILSTGSSRILMKKTLWNC